MTTQEFKPGDVVKLKSGSPDLVVVKQTDDSKEHMKCSYWDYGMNIMKDVTALKVLFRLANSTDVLLPLNEIKIEVQNG